MATDCIAQLTFRYQGIRSPVVARFDVPHASWDGGLVLLKAVDERLQLTGPALGSQPTLSRFENAVGRRDLVRVGHRLARTVIAHHRRRLHGRTRRITIDLDPTDDPTHGQQELSFPTRSIPCLGGTPVGFTLGVSPAYGCPRADASTGSGLRRQAPRAFVHHPG